MTDEIYALFLEEFKSEIEEIKKRNHEESIDESDLDDILASSELKSCVKLIFKLNFHMILNEPEIKIDLVSKDNLSSIRLQPQAYDKDKHLCLDGFPREGNPCVVVINSPM